MALIEGFCVRNYRALRDVTLGRLSTQQEGSPLTPFTVVIGKNGYGKTPGIDAVVVIVDSDRRPCSAFLGELKAVLRNCRSAPNTLFRLAIEEIEAWFLGDRQALLKAYPRAKRNVLAHYQQDSVCGTWELLADAVHPGGSAAIRAAGWPLPGQIKHEWAERIGPHMDIENNQSPSFCKFRDALRRLVA